MKWMNVVRDFWRGYSDADIRSIVDKIDAGLLNNGSYVEVERGLYALLFQQGTFNRRR